MCLRETKGEFLFCKPLETTIRNEDVLQTVDHFFKGNGFGWDNLMKITTNGTPAKLGSRSGFQALMKQRAPLATRDHHLIHREALTSKTLPAHLNTILKGLVNK